VEEVEAVGGKRHLCEKHFFRFKEKYIKLIMLGKVSEVTGNNINRIYDHVHECKTVLKDVFYKPNYFR